MKGQRVYASGALWQTGSPPRSALEGAVAAAYLARVQAVGIKLETGKWYKTRSGIKAYVSEIRRIDCVVWHHARDPYRVPHYRNGLVKNLSGDDPRDIVGLWDGQ